tara:strand:+ start:2967 stop:3458 length:492 start_codon:yes stop_codon:yes gene_type:complete
MKNDLKIFLGIFFCLAASRFIPHPPNFTSLIALSFYVPALLGRKYLAAVLISFIITDIFIGFHGTVLFTWGSVLIIGLISNFFKGNLLSRFSGLFLGLLIFFILSNFGVWVRGFYGYDWDGLIKCYLLAIPFFGQSILSTIIYSSIIEGLYKVFNPSFKKISS